MNVVVTVHVVDTSGTPLMDPVHVDCRDTTLLANVLTELQRNPHALVHDRPYHAMALYASLTDVQAQSQELSVLDTVAEAFAVRAGDTPTERQKTATTDTTTTTNSSVSYDLYVVLLAIRETPVSHSRWKSMVPLVAWPGKEEQEEDYEQADRNAVIWRLPRASLDGFGFAFLNTCGNQLIYRRHVWQRLESQFLSHDVMARGKIGWLRGQRGSGRSLLLLTFALTMLHPAGWTITWISLSLPVAVRIHCDTTRTRKFVSHHPHRAADLDEMLSQVPFSQNHFVIVENLENEKEMEVTLAVVAEWLHSDGNHRSRKRLVVSSTFAPRSSDRQCLSKTAVAGDPDAKQHGDEKHEKESSVVVGLMPAWTVDEFVAAVAHDEIYESVRNYLDGSDVSVLGSPPSRETLARAKFYYAGGNASHLFRARARGLEDHGDINAMHIAFNCCNRGQDVPTDLFDEYEYECDEADDGGGDGNMNDADQEQQQGSGPRVAKVLSPFMAARFACCGGERLLRFFSDPDDHTADRIAVERGTMLETQFYASLWSGSLTVHTPPPSLSPHVVSCSDAENSNNAASLTWEGPIRWLSVTNERYDRVLDPVVCHENSPRWWKLPHCNAGGFDVVFADTLKGIVRFVQLAKPPFTRHGVVHWAFAATFLENLTARACELSHEPQQNGWGRYRTEPVASPLVIQFVEMFVVMDEAFLSSFRIESMTETQRMVDVVQRLTTDSRWATDEKGVSALVQIVGMRGCWTSWQDCEAYDGET